MSDSWHSYPSIFALGHRGVANLFDGDVVVEEKVDGSQFSFGRFGDELRLRSKGKQMEIDAPEKMFNLAAETVKRLGPQLVDGWTYRGEYLQKPKHNTLKYSRVPAQNIIIFDINPDHEVYLSPEEKEVEAKRLGLEVVPLLTAENVKDMETFKALLARESCLGGATIEGVVVKNYTQFGRDKKALMGKFVSEAFKEVHRLEWKQSNPGRADILLSLIAAYKTEARWQKSVQQLREAGVIEDSPRDIGKLIVAAGADIEKECKAEIMEALFKWAWPQIKRGAIAGLPEWYKEQLLAKQFGE